MANIKSNIQITGVDCITKNKQEIKQNQTDREGETWREGHGLYA